MLKRQDLSKKRLEIPQTSKDFLALQRLGYRYRKGNGVPLDEKASYECFRKAAEQGLAESQCNVGYCLELGLGVAEDFKEALVFYRKAAEQGDSDALGKGTHWAFIFGWESDQYGIPFVKGTHVGVYFEAPSSKFYESNKQLPDKNPLAPGDLKKFRYSFFQIPIDEELFKKEGREMMVNGTVKQF